MKLTVLEDLPSNLQGLIAEANADVNRKIHEGSPDVVTVFILNPVKPIRQVVADPLTASEPVDVLRVTFRRLRQVGELGRYQFESVEFN